MNAADSLVLDFLRRRGPGFVTAREAAEATGVRADIVRGCIASLARENLISCRQWAADYGTGRYEVL